MNPQVLLIVGAVGLVGCVVLLLLGMQMLRDERAKKSGATKAEPSPSASAAPDKQPLTERLGLGARQKGSTHEVLRVLRDNLTGRLAIEVGGRRYSQASQIDDPATYQALLTTLRDLHEFVGAPAEDVPVSVPAPRAVPPERTGTGPLAPSAHAAQPPASAMHLPPPTMNPFKQMQVLRELAKIPEAPTLTIAEQIDEVLQSRVEGTPLAQRGLRMRPSPRGDAIFDLDGRSYTSVGDVPDADVREVIRAAIAAWESK